MHKLMPNATKAFFGLAGLVVTMTTSAIELGAAAPSFTAATFDNRPVSLADYRGKVVFVDFWASWCSPCRQSLPMYDKLAGEFAAADFVVIAVNVDEQAADARKFLSDHPVKYITLQNPQGDIPKAFGLSGMPSSYLIDRDGTVRRRYVGFEPADMSALKNEISTLIRKPAGAS